MTNEFAVRNGNTDTSSAAVLQGVQTETDPVSGLSVPRDREQPTAVDESFQLRPRSVLPHRPRARYLPFPMPRPHSLLCAAILACGCAESADRPTPIWDPSGGDFFDMPWPLDDRRDPEGTLDMEGFPNPYRIGLLDSYVAHMETLDGFGNNSPVYFGFEVALDPDSLPTPNSSTSEDSSLILVDVDPASPYWGERFPLQWHVQDFPDSRYYPEHTLAVAPVYGFPLRRNTKYALLITTDAADPAPGFSKVWQRGDPRYSLFADVPDALFFAGIGTDDVAVGTVFTTGDPVGEMAKISRFIQDQVAPPNLDLPLEQLAKHDTYTAFRTHYPSPVFTHGERPYQLEGGGFEFDDDGVPLIGSWDDMRLSVCAPTEVEMPAEGWPVVIYQHGTGGDYRGFCNSDRALEVANRLGIEGMVGLGIDQPLHGTRLGDGLYSDLNNFNILNPDSGITNFRQGAIDVVYFARALARQSWTFTTPDGVAITTDPDNVLFMGHSQGGLTGALAAPFVGQDLKAMVLSGAGGVLAITVVVRVDVVDFAQLVHSILLFEEEEEVIEFHPVLGLIQTAVEVTDPINYGPHWFSQPGDWAGHTPAQILLTSGTLDEATDYKTAVALAASARLPVLAPMASSADAIAMRGIEASQGPLIDNARTFAGTSITAGFSQWTDGTHWVVFEEEQASDLYINFLRSTADGQSALWFE